MNQTGWVLVNVVLVAVIMIESMGNVKIAHMADFGESPRRDHVAARCGRHMHRRCGPLACVAVLNDVLPRRLHVSGWKRLMRLTLAGYWTVALLGFALACSG